MKTEIKEGAFIYSSKDNEPYKLIGIKQLKFIKDEKNRILGALSIELVEKFTILDRIWTFKIKK